MAKANSRKAQAPAANTKRISIIAGVILLAIILAFSIILGVTYKRSDANAYGHGTFYVDVNGSRYYKDGAINLKRNSITEFKCGYVGNVQSADKLYNVKITSTVNEQTAFTYTLDGARRLFLNGEDYTDCFDIIENVTAFSISHVNDTPETILQKRYPGKTVHAPETNPAIPYFTLTISNFDNSQSISFALTFGDPKLELDPGGIIF